MPSLASSRDTSRALRPASPASPSKLRLQSDKGGESSRSIEDLVEELIPRFTEIVEPSRPSQYSTSAAAALTGKLHHPARFEESDHLRDKVGDFALMQSRGDHSSPDSSVSCSLLAIYPSWTQMALLQDSELLGRLLRRRTVPTMLPKTSGLSVLTKT